MENNLFLEAGDLALDRNIPEELQQLSQLKKNNELLKGVLIVIVLAGVVYIGYRIVNANAEEKKNKYIIS